MLGWNIKNKFPGDRPTHFQLVVSASKSSVISATSLGTNQDCHIVYKHEDRPKLVPQNIRIDFGAKRSIPSGITQINLVIEDAKVLHKTIDITARIVL
jgi:hypothetical protein